MIKNGVYYYPILDTIVIYTNNPYCKRLKIDKFPYWTLFDGSKCFLNSQEVVFLGKL